MPVSGLQPPEKSAELRGTALGLTSSGISQEERSWDPGRTGSGSQGGQELGHSSWLLKYELKMQMKGLGAAGEAQAVRGRVSRLTALLLCRRRHSYRTGQDIANCGTCRDCACIIYR